MATPSKKAPQCCNKCFPGRSSAPRYLSASLSADCLGDPCEFGLELTSEHEDPEYRNECISPHALGLIVVLTCCDGIWKAEIIGT